MERGRKMMGEPTGKRKFKSEDVSRADGEKMTENRKITLEEPTDRFVGKLYDYEAEKA